MARSSEEIIQGLRKDLKKAIGWAREEHEDSYEHAKPEEFDNLDQDFSDKVDVLIETYRASMLDYVRGEFFEWDEAKDPWIIKWKDGAITS